MRQAHCWLLIENVTDLTLEIGGEFESRDVEMGVKQIFPLACFWNEGGISHVSDVQDWDTTLAQ